MVHLQYDFSLNIKMDSLSILRQCELLGVKTFLGHQLKSKLIDVDFADLLKKLHFHVSLTLDGIMDSFNEKMCRITKKLASKKDCCCSNTLQSKNENSN